MGAMETHHQGQPAAMQTAVRNRYYFGKLLDVVHFDIEQDYFNYKRSLLSRMVLGYGVVCGLDVRLSADGKSVSVSSGFAIDRWGREIIVPSESRELDLPEPPAVKQPAETAPCDDYGAYYQLVVCYHECAGSSEPSMADECGAESCVPSLVQERYKLEWRKGKAPEPPNEDCLSDLISGDRINRRALALRVARRCQQPNCEPCLVLANVKVPRANEQSSVDIDITVRPIVYTNDLLYELILAMGSSRQSNPRLGK